MTIQEMVISVQLETKTLSANRNRKLLDPEIEWLLNKVQARYIKSCLVAKKDGSGGFEINQLYTDAIRMLLSTRQLYAAAQPDNTYMAFLPADYAYLISDDSQVVRVCATAPVLVPLTTTLLAIPMPLSSRTDPKFYQTVVLNYGTAVALADIATANLVTYQGFSSNVEYYVVVDSLLWWMRNRLKVDVYWERYLDTYRPKTFLFPAKTTGSGSLDGASLTGTLIDGLPVLNSYNEPLAVWSPNRLSPSTKISSLNAAPYYKSAWQSPISELSAGYLKVYGDDRFIVNKVSVTYVRKPRRMSLILGCDCELAEEFHGTLCDLTVEFFKGMLNDPGWEIKLKDNMLRSATIQ